MPSAVAPQTCRCGPNPSRGVVPSPSVTNRRLAVQNARKDVSRRCGFNRCGAASIALQRAAPNCACDVLFNQHVSSHNVLLRLMSRRRRERIGIDPAYERKSATANQASDTRSAFDVGLFDCGTCSMHRSGRGQGVRVWTFGWARLTTIRIHGSGKRLSAPQAE